MISKRETALKRPERISIWSEALRDDKGLVLAAVQHDGAALEYVSSRLCDDYEVVLTSVKGNGAALKWASTRLQDNYDIVYAAIKSRHYGRSGAFTPLQYASKRLRDNKEIVEAAVSIFPNSGYAFSLASERLRGDKSIALRAFRHSNELYYLKYIPDSLFSSRSFVLEFFQRLSGRDIDISCFFERMNSNFINDKEIILSAVQKSGYALKYASSELCGDRDVVMAAIHNAGRALEYASAELRDAKDVVMAAIQNDSFSFSYASEELRDKEEILIAAINNTPSSSAWNPLKVASERLRDNKDIVMLAVQRAGMYGLLWASDRLKKDEDLLKAENMFHTGRR